MVDEGNAGIHEGSTGNSTGNSAGNSESRPGKLLRKKRESLGFTVAYVAEHLRLTEDYIHYLENDDFNKLPSEPFVLGYYRAYARILGLSADEVIGLYRDFISGRSQGTSEGLMADKQARHQTEKRGPQTLERNKYGQGKTPKSRGLGNRIYLIVTLALIGIWVVVSLLSEKQSNEASRGAPAAKMEVSSSDAEDRNSPEATKTEVPAVEEPATSGDAKSDLQPRDVETSTGLPEASAAAESVNAEAIIEAEAEVSPMNAVQAEAWQQLESSESVIDTEPQVAEKAEPVPANKSTQPSAVAESQDAFDTLVFTFADDCWLEVRDVAGDVLTAKVYNAGDTIELKGIGPFKLMLGNVRAAQLSLNGVQVALTPNGSRKTLRTTVGDDAPVSE
ncbi:helix-turn-helix domain-containing protein [Aestuariicella hydrocarbonica]|uniref:Helix-turn-helix domain-containing protein n=1 Tax=Pseudomaricurvus hydrocarbonicus TaxID=1470433 RepID=A0A9E5MQG3_9GAMM|nr:RodZ domain-containing protein [Aestuariicella hydrocarbonica]NHO68452.1 helix-turn-helix domain-containing protein [Aestuariicella hydrocarbonica]